MRAPLTSAAFVYCMPHMDTFRPAAPDAVRADAVIATESFGFTYRTRTVPPFVM
jgi:hypothetical protein